MERAVTASEANQRFSELLREVGRGESFVVTSRGRPVARVSPVDDPAGRAGAIDDLLRFAASLPRRRLDGWRRNDLYG